MFGRARNDESRLLSRTFCLDPVWMKLWPTLIASSFSPGEPPPPRSPISLLLTPTALLVQSRSGQTRTDTPPTTESQSYLRLAIASQLLPPISEFRRATTEEYALDSLQNLLFGYARFREVTGGWPRKVTVVGYEMKRPR